MKILGLDKIKREEEHEIIGLEMIKKQGGESPFSVFAVQLIDLINRAKDCDTGFEEFGSDIHRYELNPVIPLSKVRDFENRHNISLPQTYVNFLTNVGNGGAGPDYGLYSLEEVEYYNYYNHTKHHSTTADNIIGESDFYTVPYSIDFSEPIVNSELTKEKWEEWCKKLDRKDKKKYDLIRPEIYNGLLEIADSGCSYCIMLICSGDLYGQTAKFDHDFHMPFIMNTTFENWITGHFKKVIELYGERK